MTPTIPPHLRGRVTNVQEEGPNQFVINDSHGNGLPGDRGLRQELNLRQYQATFDPDYRRRNFTRSMKEQYGAAEDPPKTGTERVAGMVSGVLGNSYRAATSSQGKSLASAGLISALIGGGLGAWSARRGDKPAIPRAVLFAALSGMLGAGGLAYSQSRHNQNESRLGKSAGLKKSASVSRIIREISNDKSLSATEKSSLLKAVARLDTPDQRELSLMMGLSGVAAGAIASRFLRSKGLLLPALGGMIGLMASRPKGRTKLNQFGRPVR